MDRIASFIFIIFSFCQMNLAFGQTISLSDSLTKKQIREYKKKEFKNSQIRNFFKFGVVDATLDTELSFEVLDGFFTAKLGLENNLGLPDQRNFFNGSFIHRFTPNSGIYLQYYGINRSKSYEIEKDLIFLRDTIPAGTKSVAFFNTQVVSAGYLLTLKEDQNAFLGSYFNVYVMEVNTGVKSDIGNLNSSLKYFAPLPNFGLVAIFKIRKWLDLDANLGFFSLEVNDFDGTLYDFSTRLIFKPSKWLGFSLSYQEFDINIKYPYKEVLTTVEYNFRGPALGISLSF